MNRTGTRFMLPCLILIFIASAWLIAEFKVPVSRFINLFQLRSGELEASSAKYETTRPGVAASPNAMPALFDVPAPDLKREIGNPMISDNPDGKVVNLTLDLFPAGYGFLPVQKFIRNWTVSLVDEKSTPVFTKDIAFTETNGNINFLKVADALSVTPNGKTVSLSAVFIMDKPTNLQVRIISKKPPRLSCNNIAVTPQKSPNIDSEVASFWAYPCSFIHGGNTVTLSFDYTPDSDNLIVQILGDKDQEFVFRTVRNDK